MVYKIKSPVKKQLKKPDEFITLFSRIVLYVKGRARQFSVFLGVAILVALGVAIYFFLVGRADRQARILEYEASGYYHGTALAGQKGAKVAPNYQKALELYQQVVEKYPGTSSAMLSQYYIGNSYFELKNYDEAAKAYRKFNEKYHENHGLASLVYERLGYTALLQGNSQEAMDAFKKIVAMKDAKNQDQALFEIGRLYEKMEQKNEAIEEYKIITKNYMNSPLAIEARVRIKKLGGDVPSDVKAVPEVKIPMGTIPKEPAQQAPKK
jgi:tetratricopeptide (TPR) repeat protein